MSDYSTTCPWTFLGEMVEGGSFPKELFSKLHEENKKLKEKQEYFRVRNCDRMEELVKALSPWKKNHGDHKRILEAIGELQEQIEKLKTFKSEVIEAMKYDDDLDDEDIIRGIRGMEEDIVGECELKEQIEELQDCRTIVAELGQYVEYIDQNACDVFNKLTEKYRSEFDPSTRAGLTMEEKDAIVAKLISNRAS